MSDVFQWPFFCNGLHQMNRTERLKIVSGINVDLQVRRSKLINLALFARKLIKIAFRSDSVDWFDTT